ncbi:MAG: hypothetical protein DA330_05610 [Nitrososphaera sp.]|nr:hypothetical protein [Nitrososphaera sp.]
MLDILACPVDKHYPLELYEINTQDQEIQEGILFCSKCSRFYPITEEIPVMLPDELREKQRDLDFLGKWQDKVPEKVKNQGKPWHL